MIYLLEAEEALDAIQSVAQRTRRSIAEGGTCITLVITGVVWLVGFMATQFLPQEIVGYIWTGLTVVGTILGIVLGSQRSKRLRSAASTQMMRLILRICVICWT